MLTWYRIPTALHLAYAQRQCLAPLIQLYTFRRTAHRRHSHTAGSFDKPDFITYPNTAMGSRFHPSLLAHVYNVSRQDQTDHPGQSGTSHPANQVPQRPVPVTMAAGSSAANTAYADARMAQNAQANVERMVLLQHSAGAGHTGWTPNSRGYLWNDEQQIVYTRGYLDGLQSAQNTILNMQVGTLNRYSPYSIPPSHSVPSTHGQYLPDPPQPTYYTTPPPYNQANQYYVPISPPPRQPAMPGPLELTRIMPAGGASSPIRRRPQKADKPTVDQAAARQGRTRLEAVLKRNADQRTTTKATAEEDVEVNVVD